MKIVFPILIMACSVLAQNPTPHYYVIYGNQDGSTIDVNLDSDIEIEVWAATPDTNIFVGFIHNPLASDDNQIAIRDSGEVFYPISTWDAYFMAPDSISSPGYTNQSLIAFIDLGNPSSIPLNTWGDTIHIANFFMRTANDSSLIGQTVCPLVEGFDPANGGIFWGLTDGITTIIPAQTFSCLYFVDYLAGDANGSGAVTAEDVLFLVNYFKGSGIPPDPMLAGDANGDCIVNGVDVLYLVAYFKGGPEPFYGDCH